MATAIAGLLFSAKAIGWCIVDVLPSTKSINEFRPNIVRAELRWSPAVKAIFAENGYPWVACTYSCNSRKWPSKCIAHSTLLPAIVIDGHSTQDIVAEDIYRFPTLSLI